MSGYSITREVAIGEDGKPMRIWTIRAIADSPEAAKTEAVLGALEASLLPREEYTDRGVRCYREPPKLRLELEL